MKIRAIMSTQVSTARPDDYLNTATQFMVWSGGRHLPVVDGDRVVGVLSEADVIRARGGAHAAPVSMLVRDAMTQPVHCIAPDDSVAAAAGRMADERISCLPVLEHGMLVGIVTTTDILKAMERQTFESGPASRPS